MHVMLHLLHQVRALIPALALAFPDMKIILRPHPVENVQAWRRWLAELPNAEVVREGPFIAWTLAADPLIHGNFTTKLEACLLSRQSIAPTPFKTSRHESLLPNGVSIRTGSVEEPLQAIQAIREGSTGMDKQQQTLLHHARKAMRCGHARDIHRRNIFPDTGPEKIGQRLRQIAQAANAPLLPDTRMRTIMLNIFEPRPD